MDVEHNVSIHIGGLDDSLLFLEPMLKTLDREVVGEGSSLGRTLGNVEPNVYVQKYGSRPLNFIRPILFLEYGKLYFTSHTP